MGSVVSATPAASSALYESSITSLPLLGRGKVRENYAVGDDKLLMVTTDRLSAFDVILGQPIPDKGKVLAQMSDFWFNKLRHIVPTHETGIAPETVVAPNEVDQVRGRAIVVKRLKPILVEAVVRGYLAGSGWKDYQATGAVCGVQLAPGLQNAQKLPEPIFTPAAKAEMGEHDENISFDEVERRIGPDLAAQIRDVSIRLYKEASDFAATRGIIIADTKFEFGLDENGTLTLMDEALTADSSRFWPADSYQVGTNPPSFDKQFVRDWLEAVRIDGKPWPKTAPAPELPADVIEKTADKYREALTRLTGQSLR
nr:phosphoribosylaminoimidazolesuccinocarboxamide synthase [Ralstonia insidiosa]